MFAEEDTEKVTYDFGKPKRRTRDKSSFRRGAVKRGAVRARGRYIVWRGKPRTEGSLPPLPRPIPSRTVAIAIPYRVLVPSSYWTSSTRSPVPGSDYGADDYGVRPNARVPKDPRERLPCTTKRDPKRAGKFPLYTYPPGPIGRIGRRKSFRRC